jgi:hypothetical protein
MRHLFGDLRSGVRMLMKYPTLSIVAIATFGLGLGLATTAFNIINGARNGHDHQRPGRGRFQSPDDRVLGARRIHDDRAESVHGHAPA